MSPSPIPEYATTRLIAYIGNKRALLPFLRSVFLEEASRLGSKGPPRFLDPFAGSGSASRLARCLGWCVLAGDAEEYSRAVNEAWLGVSADERPSLFCREGGMAAAFDSINALHPCAEGRGGARALASLPPGDEPEPYMSRHYAPADTQRADWRRERLFYTRENALFLDRARCAIDRLRPPSNGDPLPGPEGPVSSRSPRAERALLLGALLYEAATHANTSGVFKAYHKGFGGHGRDALGRILAPMRLEPPLLWPGPPAEVRREDATLFCSSRPAELCYLDPPYNQHQYGSNYHILNTLAKWDRPSVNDERGPDGRFLHVSGIPGGWTESRSPYCSRQAAPAAFRSLLGAIDAPVVLLSYNSDGIVEPGELYDILSDRAEVSLRSVEYVAYRGGRQSASRREATSEILFVARRREGGRPGARSSGSAPSPGERSRELRALRARLELGRLLSGAFDPEAFLRAAGSPVLAFEARDGRVVEISTYRGLVVEPGSRRVCSGLDADDAEALAELLRPALLPDNAAACGAVAGLIEGGARDRRAQDLALSWLRKLAYRRYEGAFRAMSERLSKSARGDPEGLRRLERGLREIGELFERRLAGRSPVPPS